MRPMMDPSSDKGLVGNAGLTGRVHSLRAYYNHEVNTNV